jgi:hypothetical protein
LLPPRDCGRTSAGLPPYSIPGTSAWSFIRTSISWFRGAGLDVRGKVVRVRQADYLVRLPHLQAAFRQHMRRQFEARGWHADPQVWIKDWGVHIQPAGSGAAALRYLGAYVARLTKLIYQITV